MQPLCCNPYQALSHKPSIIKVGRPGARVPDGHAATGRLIRHFRSGPGGQGELTASKRPFIYFRLIHHFEQNFHVRHRLDQYGAGVCMDFTTTDPDRLAAAITRTIGQQTTYRDVETDGARRAAAMIAELL